MNDVNVYLLHVFIDFHDLNNSINFVMPIVCTLIDVLDTLSLDILDFADMASL